MLTDPTLFSGHADRIKDELGQLIKADALEYGRRSVILLPGQGFCRCMKPSVTRSNSIVFSAMNFLTPAVRSLISILSAA